MNGCGKSKVARHCVGPKVRIRHNKNSSNNNKKNSIVKLNRGVKKQTTMFLVLGPNPKWATNPSLKMKTLPYTPIIIPTLQHILKYPYTNLPENFT